MTNEQLAESQRRISERVCAIWIYKDGMDSTRFKFWAQVLECKDSQLIKFARMARALDKRGTCRGPFDPILISMWDILKGMNPNECKNVFNDLRK